jgi:hypothetical protein
MPGTKGRRAVGLLLGGLPLVAPAGPADPPPVPPGEVEALLEFLGEGAEAEAAFDQFFDSLPERPEATPPPPVSEEDKDQ